MANSTETSDSTILDLLRQTRAMSVTRLAEETGVTATAVRQRLSRLMGQGFISRRLEHSGRGRPSHQYSLTEKGCREAGTNYDDLAIMLWKEIRGVKDPEVRRGLLQRMAVSIARTYADRVQGDTLAERMESLGEPGRIQVAKGAWDRLKGGFILEPRGEIEVKGKGLMHTWFLEGAQN